MKLNREMLAQRGTPLNELKPANLIQAAHADLGRKRRNAVVADDYGGRGGYEQYAFHRHHVRRAIDAGDLLVRALMDPTPGLESDKFNTRMIYGNAELLISAIHLAREKEIG